jgi:hypothetical protein
MSETHCPICYTPLEVVDVAPCMVCGAIPHEIEDALKGKHTYAEYCFFGDLTLVLCDFCVSDLRSYYPSYFGLPKEAKSELENMRLTRSIYRIEITKDKFCPDCGERSAFLRFVEQARELNTKQNATS